MTPSDKQTFGYLQCAIACGATHNVYIYTFLFLVLFYVGFALCLYCFYIMSPITMKYSSATLVNLSILTGNVYNLCWGLFLFNYKVSNAVYYWLKTRTQDGDSFPRKVGLVWYRCLSMWKLVIWGYATVLRKNLKICARML